MYVLVGIPLVGILCNVALFIHVSSRVDHLAERMGDRLDAMSDRLAKVEASHGGRP